MNMKKINFQEYNRAIKYVERAGKDFSFTDYCERNKIPKVEGIILFAYIIIVFYHSENNLRQSSQVPPSQCPIFASLDGKDLPWGTIKYPLDIILPTVLRTVAAVLSAWLENDHEHMQTVNSFVTQITKVREYERKLQEKDQKEEANPTNKKSKRRITELPPEKFLSKSEQQDQAKTVSSDSTKGIPTNKSEKIYKAYLRAEAIFTDMQNLQILQAKDEGRWSAPISFQVKTGQTVKRYYNFPTLCTLQLLANDHSKDSDCSSKERFLSPLFDMLVYRKKPMKVAKDATRLVEAYDSFNKMVAHFKKTRSEREYVAFCMSFMKIEYAFRFQLIAELTVYQQKHDKPLGDPLPELAALLWHRGMGLSEQMDTLAYLDEEIDGNRYPGQISMLYAEGNDMFKYARHTYATREFFSNAQLVVFNMLRPENMGAWSDLDFKKAADFFKNNYPVVERYKPIEIAEDEVKQKQFCQRFTHVYNSLIGEAAEDFRKKMQAEKRSRRATSKKSSIDPLD